MKLLIVEDEKDVASAICRILSRNGYSVDLASNGKQALDMVEVNDYDLMILDLNLPDLDGLEICRCTRTSHSGLLILILTARDKLEDIVKGLDAGADDYLTKPFQLAEIMARIRALLRRDMRCRNPLLTINGLCLDPAERVVWKANRRLELTRKEFGILEYLMRHPGEVISQETLLEHVWGSNMDPFSNTVRVHIQSLRRKLEDVGTEAKYIETVVGEGYRLLKN
jgi:DNA-binding response OmpR family regulator